MKTIRSTETYIRPEAETVTLSLEGAILEGSEPDSGEIDGNNDEELD